MLRLLWKLINTLDKGDAYMITFTYGWMMPLEDVVVRIKTQSGHSVVVKYGNVVVYVKDGESAEFSLTEVK